MFLPVIWALTSTETVSPLNVNQGSRPWTVGEVAHKMGTVSDSVYCGHMNKTTLIFPLSPEMQATWDDIMGQMISFVNDTNADVDMAYDWVCEMLNIDTFVDNEAAWNSFYDVWESCDNRKDRPFFHEYNFAWFYYARN